MIESLASLRAQFIANPPVHCGYFDENDPRKLQPLSLEQQKNRARELLRKWQANPSNSAQQRNPGDARQAIAKGYGFNNWAELKTHIVQADIAREALRSGEPGALDADCRCLHIRCGDDIQRALAVAGFNGDFLVFADPYVHGPVPQTATLEEFIRIRAAYISSDLNPPYEKALRGLQEDYAGLDKAREYDAVYLWFEHDSYDQLIVAKLLDYFSDATNRPPVLKMINITHFPGVEIFNGLGQLPPEAMRVLWGEFVDVTAAQLATGQQAWAAIRSPAPMALQQLVRTGTSDLPSMAPALARHLRQLPSKRNGLNLTENLTLQILHEKGSMNAARLFGWYTNHYEPLTFMGDTGYWQILDDLAGVEHPAVSINKRGEKPRQWQVTLTDTGCALISNKVDWLQLNRVDRWVGGIHIDTCKGSVYRIDDAVESAFQIKSDQSEFTNKD